MVRKRALQKRYGHARSWQYTVITGTDETRAQGHGLGLGKWVNRKTADRIAETWARTSRLGTVIRIMREDGHEARRLEGQRAA